ncbi:hypothetical protein [Bacillus salipaludis]|uniref:hypothetical protein n=1 Tax=Bacillus salipaludis TaxID=2547811 RepID=UPI002E1C8701|nr:hypothetical protein [Bacillus salipaludis]
MSGFGFRLGLLLDKVRRPLSDSSVQLSYKVGPLSDGGVPLSNKHRLLSDTCPIVLKASPIVE